MDEMKTGTNLEVKQCICCQNTIIRTNRQCKSVWLNVRFCSRECSTQWQLHGKPFSEMPPDPIRHCLYCNTLLVRRPNKHWQSWQKRKYCNKTCSAYVKGGNRQDNTRKKLEPTRAERSHCTIYQPGTLEFETIANYYLNCKS